MEGPWESLKSMGERPRQANTTTSAVVYGRITESEDTNRMKGDVRGEQ